MSEKGHAIWLYGSHARGGSDSYSDIDILVITSELDSVDEIKGSTLLAQTGASLSVYTWNEIRRMAEYGSLFLQHLKLEAVLLHESPSYCGTLRKMLDQLPSYRYATRDLTGFKVVLNDVSEALDDDGEESYELAVLGTVIRHCSILGCWLLNQPSFGRHEPVSRFARLQRIDCVLGEEFSDLYSYRLYADERIERESLKDVSAARWLSRAWCIVASVEELTRDGN